MTQSDLPNSAYGVIKLLPDTKQGIEIFSKQIVDAVRNGEINPLELKAYFKKMERVIDKVNDLTKDEQLTEAEKYSAKKFDAFGCNVEVSELGVKYDYLGCGDTIYERLDTDLNTAKRKVSEREAFLKSLKEPLTVVDEMTGEVITILPPIKTSTTGLKFSI